MPRIGILENISYGSHPVFSVMTRCQTLCPCMKRNFFSYFQTGTDHNELSLPAVVGWKNIQSYTTHEKSNKKCPRSHVYESRLRLGRNTCGLRHFLFYLPEWVMCYLFMSQRLLWEFKSWRKVVLLSFAHNYSLDASFCSIGCMFFIGINLNRSQNSATIKNFTSIFNLSKASISEKEAFPLYVVQYFSAHLYLTFQHTVQKSKNFLKIEFFNFFVRLAQKIPLWRTFAAILVKNIVPDTYGKLLILQP